MIYFDAAYVAKCYLNEPGAERVRALASGAPGLCSCELGRLEFGCIVQRHLREGHISAREAREVLRDFRSDEAGGVWHWFPLSSALLGEVYERVAGLPRTAYLRAADAIHLGCARANGFTRVYSNDRHMLAAAPHFEVAGVDVIEVGPEGH